MTVSLSSLFTSLLEVLLEKLLPQSNKYASSQELLKKISLILNQRSQNYTSPLQELEEKEFLFECLMHRLDLLTENKRTLQKIYQILPKHPGIVCVWLKVIQDYFSQELTTVKRYTGIQSYIMPHLLTILYVMALPTWFHDTSTALSTTMAYLDRSLSTFLHLRDRLT